MKRFLKRLGRGVLVAALLFVGWLFAVWPPPIWYATHFPSKTAFMRMRQRDEAAFMRAESRYPYRPVPFDSISPNFLNAVIRGEDNRFWSHGGLDFVELRHAIGYRRDDFSWFSGSDVTDLLARLPHAWERRDQIRGASTISQQLAKNLYLSPSRNPLRKVKEAVTAYRLEWALGKRRILELYANVVEMGPDTWGVAAASDRYFHRAPARLSRSQSAALAGLLPFPLLSNPEHRPGRMYARQSLILRRMRGERVEVPKVAADIPEAPPIPAESVPEPALDSLPDTLITE